MKKLFISIFLMLTIVVSGLSSLSYTPIVSAINKSAVRCDFLGQYINSASTGSPCQPCPVDSYCPLVSGTEIENCATKGYPDSDCKESRKIFSIDKSIPCPAGTSTKGFTYNTLQGTRITLNGDPIFPIVGQGATDPSMCKAPDFKCEGATPVLLKGTDGVAKCYPANTCNADQIAILKDGVPDCSVACKTNVIVHGKCLQSCPAGEYLEVVGESTNCKKTFKQNNCPVVGQVLTNNDVSTCICVSPQTLSADKTKCELPIVPCVLPQTGNQPNCVNPVVKPCPANQYGYNQPNCKPCPAKGTSPEGTIDSSGCVIPVVPCPENYYGTNGNINCTPCPAGSKAPGGTQTLEGCKAPVIPYVDCPANYYGVNGNVNCTPCPNEGTSDKGTKEQSGCKAKQNGGGGEGLCGGWLAIACAAVVGGIACGFKVFGLCAGGSSGSNSPSTPTSTTTQTDKISTTTRRDKLLVKKIKANGTSDCPEVNGAVNSVLINSVFNDNGADAHLVKGEKYLWVATYAIGKKTQTVSTIRPAGGQDGTSSSSEEVNAKAIDSSLQCLMQRFAKVTNTQIGSSQYMAQLKSYGVLHGLNKLYKLECLNLTYLERALAQFPESYYSNVSGGVKYIVSNETQSFDYPETYDTEKAAAEFAKATVAKISKKVNVVNTKTNELKIEVDGKPDISNTAEVTYEPQTSLNIKNILDLFGTVKASAAVDTEVADDTDPEGNQEDVVAAANTGSTEDALSEIIYEITGDGEDDPLEGYNPDQNNDGQLTNSCLGVLPSYFPGCETELESAKSQCESNNNIWDNNECKLSSDNGQSDSQSGYGDGSNQSTDGCATDESSVECDYRLCVYNESYCQTQGPTQQKSDTSNESSYSETECQSNGGTYNQFLGCQYVSTEPSEQQACDDSPYTIWRDEKCVPYNQETNTETDNSYLVKIQCEAEGKTYSQYFGCYGGESASTESAQQDTSNPLDRVPNESQAEEKTDEEKCNEAPSTVWSDGRCVSYENPLDRL